MKRVKGSGIMEKQISNAAYISYTLSANLLIDSIECVIEDVKNGEKLTDEKLGYVKTRINMLRKLEEMLNKKFGI